MADTEQLILLLEQRDKAQAEAQQRLVQAQIEGAKNLAGVASALSQVHGSQQDAHDVLGALERLVVNHDTTLRVHIESTTQHDSEIAKEQDRLEKLVTTGCAGCQNLQKEISDNFSTSLSKVEQAITRQTDTVQKLIDKQIGLGKIVTSIISIGAATATFLGVILTLLKIITN